MGVNDVLVISACLGAMAAALLIGQAVHKARVRRMIAAGTALGLARVAPGESIALPATELARKSRRFFGAMLQGEWNGVPMLVFDLYHSGSRSIVRQTVLGIRLAEPLPEFALVERDWNKYRPTLDIPEVKDAPAPLQRSWYVHTRDGNWPFDEALTNWLAPRADTSWLRQRWSYEGAGSRLLVYRRHRLVRASTLRSWLDEALAEAQGFAAHAHADGMVGDAVAEEIYTSSGSVERDGLRLKFSMRLKRRR